MEIGYALSGEEHHPNDLVQNAIQAEESGFTFALISDHYHPWVSEQGHSPFVWSVIGAILHATRRLVLGTGVTCPIMRIHPAILAQAAATANAMAPGRFFLGLGTGEYLNEHILGDAWPPADTRQEMLSEAIYLLRELWKGEEYTYEGEYFDVIDARIYTRAETPPQIFVAASGTRTAEAAGVMADGLIATSPDAELVEAFHKGDGQGKPTVGQLKVCWASSKEDARRTVQRWWPTSTVPGRLKTDLPTPAHFKDVVEAMGEPQVSEDTILGPDVDAYLEGLQKFLDRGFDHVYIHQVGPDQAGFFRFFREKLLPELQGQKMLTGS